MAAARHSARRGWRHRLFHQANLVAAIVLGLVERLVGHLDENPEGLSAAARHQGAKKKKLQKR